MGGGDARGLKGQVVTRGVPRHTQAKRLHHLEPIPPPPLFDSKFMFVFLFFIIFCGSGEGQTVHNGQPTPGRISGISEMLSRKTDHTVENLKKDSL